MPELPDDDIQRMPDADRIRSRIRERREAEQTEQTGDGVKFEAPADDPTSTNLKWNNIVDGGDTTAMKLDGAEHLDPNDPASWKVDAVKTADFADRVVDHKADDVAMKLDRPDAEESPLGYTENDPKHGDPWPVADDSLAHKAGEVSDPVDTAWKVEEGESLLDASSPYVRSTSDGSGGDDMTDGIFKFAVPDDTSDAQVKTGEFLDSVVDHKPDDVAMKLDRPDANFEEIKVTLTDPLPDGVVDHKADDVVDHKADDVDGPITNDPFNYEEIKVTFDDPITDTRLDKASPKGLPVDDSAEPSGDSGYEGTVATGGVSAGGTDGSALDSTFKFAVPTDVPGEGDSLKSVSGMDEAIVPTGETAMQQQPADPVGDALAPLDGGDQLVDPAPDSADLIAQIDGVHDGSDDGLDDSFGA